MEELCSASSIYKGSSCAFLGSGAGASSERFIELELGWDDIGRESEGEGEENAARH